MQNENEDLGWNSSFLVLNSTAQIFLSSAVFVFPIFALVFYLRNYPLWQYSSFKKRYGAALEGLRLDRKSSLAYPIIFMMRRFALVAVVIIFSNQLFVQVSVMVICSMIQVWYLMTYKPTQKALTL